MCIRLRQRVETGDKVQKRPTWLTLSHMTEAVDTWFQGVGV